MLFRSVGLPVVAVGAYGVAEMVNDGYDGFLTPESAEALAEKSLAVLQNKELRQLLGVQARQSAQLMAAEATAKNMADAYQGLLS